MKERQRLVVAAVLVVSLVLLAVLFGQRQAHNTASSAAGAVWLPGLKEQLSSVQRVRVQSGSAVSTLVREGERWGVAERDGYPVDTGRLGEVLEELAAARVLEPKTSKAELFDRLGLSDIEKPDSKAVLVELWAEGEEPLFRVLVGNAPEARRGRYVRLADATETWLVDRSPQAFADPADWIDRRLLGLAFEQVSRVTRTLPDKGEGFSASRKEPSQPSLALDGDVGDRKPRYESVFDAAARALLNAEAEDVSKAAEDRFPAESTVRNTIAFFDGLVLEVQSSKREDGNWVRVSASSATPAAAAPAESPAPGADAGKTPAEDLDARVQALNARLGGWAFNVSDYVHGELAKPLAEYLDDAKTEGADADDKPS
jgi:hypothetical protein